ncbi:hypothetical protein [Lacipirellula limnantheis]|uniref:PEP-CTERM protein-sorting domain-containing protein n=1 Tax=Lacipirellula limnantheis TaxID=2528024 RepID=A0A517U3L1_9BACT|nr:hypothetical protein [Lacipirellula limnantheis]QDT75206.1 hypothetical protein I41_44160 [Lacipirellula limnantheis]
MIRRVWFAPACLAVAGALGNAALAQTVVTWDGGNGEWSDLKWNGGQAPAAVMGNQNGGDGNLNVTIGGGSQVLFDSSSKSLRPRSSAGPSVFTITGGAKLTHNTPITGDPDGNWTTWDADLNLDNGTFERNWTAGGTAEAGGILMVGSWRSLQDQQITINTTNGGLLKNDGQVWFGADEEHAVGLKVSALINGGSWDLTGGTSHEAANNSHDVRADLAIWYGRQFGSGAGQDGSGDPKNEDYEINFQGPGSLTVDQGGIVVYRQNADGTWNQPDIDDNATPATRSTYEDLWNDGILKGKGMSGEIFFGDTSPRPFANYFTVTGTPGSADYKVTRKEGATVTWSGGDGNWDDAEWDTTGGASNQNSQTAFGRQNGSEGGHNIVISGAGVDVTYNRDSDFRLQNNNGFSSMTVKNGASLTLDTLLAEDGTWTRWVEDLTVDGGTFRRVKTGAGVGNGGAFILGGFAGEPGQEINIKVVNGGKIENDGQLWVGSAGGDDDYGIENTITVNNGTIDLTGGDSGNIDLLEGAFGAGVEPDMLFWYGRDGEGTALGEKHTINFTGSGSITVDHSGIWIGTMEPDFSITAVHASYEELWTRGILQANGKSGLTGDTFGTYFSVSGVFDADGAGPGTLGGENYKLTSLLSTGTAGDFDNDGDVDGADFLVWQRGGSPSPLSPADLATWKANFGASATVNVGAAVGAVPEPTALASAMVALCGLGLWRSRR